MLLIAGIVIQRDGEEVLSAKKIGCVKGKKREALPQCTEIIMEGGEAVVRQP